MNKWNIGLGSQHVFRRNFSSMRSVQTSSTWSAFSDQNYDKLLDFLALVTYKRLRVRSHLCKIGVILDTICEECGDEAFYVLVPNFSGDKSRVFRFRNITLLKTFWVGISWHVMLCVYQTVMVGDIPISAADSCNLPLTYKAALFVGRVPELESR